MRSARLLRQALLIPREVGRRFERDWKMYFARSSSSGDYSSPWHDLPLTSCKGDDPLFTYLNEIPLATIEKLELSTKVPHNPIQQDIVKKTGALRCFTYGKIPFNYGCVPQTWEDPDYVDARTGCGGDGDPVDVVELGEGPLAVGAVASVRVLGALALIDEGETDWKIIAIRSSSPLRSLSDVPTEQLKAVRDWFRNYKTTDGKPQNEFAFDGEYKDAAMAHDVLNECHQQYSRLVDGTTTNTKKLWLR